MMDMYDFITIKAEDKEQAKLLFETQNCFWLVVALASFLALDEIEKKEEHNIDDLLHIFNKWLASSDVDMDEALSVKNKAIKAMREIDKHNRQMPFFDIRQALVLSKAFVTYWLVFKLLEQQWQEDEALSAEVYMFMDGLLSDGEELERIEKLLIENKKLEIDDLVYLRCKYTTVTSFFNKVYQQAELVYGGFLDYKTFSFFKSN